MSRAPSSPRWWPRQSGGGCSPPSTSRWTGRCLRPGPRSRAARATSRSHPRAGATRMSTSRRRSRHPAGGAAVHKGTAKLSYMGHCAENRRGAGCGADRSERVRRARRRSDGAQRETLADRGYDTRDFVAELRARGVTPHVAQNDRRRSAVDGRTTRHRGYRQSQKRRKIVEQVFGPCSRRRNRRRNSPPPPTAWCAVETATA